MKQPIRRAFPDAKPLAAIAVVVGAAVAFVNLSRVTTAASVQTTITYKSSVTSDVGGLLDLKAELNYNTINTNAPIAVVMHGYSGSTGKIAEVRANAQRLRDAGFFVVSVALRGRDSSDGIRDSGGVEVYDIYDAVEHVKVNFGFLVDETNVHITGYSGGGGNAMSALTRFPDYFRAGSSYFGVSDYGYNTTTSFYYNGSDASHRAQLHLDVGNPTLGDPTVQDRYLSRIANLASRNNPYSEIHLFVNQNESTCPPFHHALYRDNAVAAASFAGEFNNINVHVGGQGQSVDFNHNGINETNELQDWPHGYPMANQQQAAESWYLSRLLSGAIVEPVLNLQDSLFVAGFVVTKRFSLWLGDGQNAAGDLAYNFAGNSWRFDLELLSNNKNVEGILKINTESLSGQLIAARLNGQIVSQFVGGGLFQQGGFGHHDILTLSVVVPGDFNGDADVDGADFVAWQTHFPTASGATLATGDADGDGDVDGADFVVWQTHFPTSSDSSVVSIAEPRSLHLLWLGCISAFVMFRPNVIGIAKRLCFCHVCSFLSSIK